MSEIISILSGKGGTGKTTVALNLAAALEKREKQVLLVDLNIGSYGSELLLGVEKRIVYHLVDVLNGNCKIIQAILDLPGYGNLKYLPAGRTIATAGISSEKIQKLLSMFRAHFDYVIVDCPTYPSQYFFDMAKYSDRAVFVSDISWMSVQNTSLSMEKFTEDVKAHCSLILNKIRKDLVKNDSVDTPEKQIETIGLPLLGMISESDDIFLQAETTDKIIDLKDPACKAFSRIAGRILGENIPFDLRN